MSGKSQRESPVSRPLRKVEYEIVLVSRQAEKGWRDALATYRNAVVEAWERLATEPTREDGERVYKLKGELGQGTYAGNTFARYQYKIPGGGRIWYFVKPSTDPKPKSAGQVLIEDVHTAHPYETK